MNTTPTLSFWDLETTGLEKAFDAPVNIGIVTTDADFNIIDTFELHCRTDHETLPAPGALLATGRGILSILGKKLSLYEMICESRAHVEALHPTIFVSYNGISYDDEIIRHTLFRMLQPPYVMQYSRSRRLDILPLARCAHALSPGSIMVPVNDKGKPFFKLDALAPANGFAEEGAHDAVVDAHATIHIAKVIKTNIPELWERTVNILTDKNMVRGLLEANEVVIQVDWNARSGQPIIKALAPITSNPTYAAEVGCIDLQFDLDDYINLTADLLVDEIVRGTRARPVCPIKTNAMPMLFELGDPLVSDLLPAPAETLIARARAARADAGLRDRLGQAMHLRRQQFPEPEYVEQTLYSGGFVNNSDAALLEKFHSALPENKLSILNEIEDERLLILGRRLIGNEWPHVLPIGEREALIYERLARLQTSDDVKWTTISSALKDIAKLKVDASPGATSILNEYEEYLRNMPALVMAAE